MRKISLIIIGGLALAMILIAPAKCRASDEGEGSLLGFIDSTEILFGRFAAVEGDTEKFRLHHWMKDGYVGGFKEFMMERSLPDDIHMSWEGRAIPKENDIDSSFHLDKKDVGFLKTHYKSFRKYYDGSGGYYRNFTTISEGNPANLDEDLKMDMGHFAVEFGPHMDNSDLSFLFERHTKDGRKSRLTWASVKEGSTTRKIGPAWQDVDEVTNILALKGRTDISGFDLSGEQRFETVHITSLREEKNLASTGVASDKTIRRQDQEPEANLLTSTLQAKRWVLNDKVFLSMGYRYYQMRNREKEDLSTFTAAGAPTGDSHNKFNAEADNEIDTHSWIGHFTGNLTQGLNFISKMKLEVVGRRGDSTYPADSTSPPDGIANTTEVSHIENRLVRTGENFSLRYTGIPKTALYTELELEQTRNRLIEERNSIAGQSSASANDIFYRETLMNTGKAIWALGGRFVPTSKLNMTAQIRHRLEKNDYDDQGESVASGTAKSAFFDALDVNGDEATFKMTYKPYRWLEPSFRYQYIVTDYIARAENQTKEESRTLWNVFSYDVNWVPTDKFLMTTSYSLQNISTTTPSGTFNVASQTRGFDSNVSTWLLSASYSPKENLSIINTLLYSRAGKFNDYSSKGLPLAIDSDRYDYTLGIRWAPHKDWTVEPHYSYYKYDTQDGADIGDYKAHVVWLDTSMHW